MQIKIAPEVLEAAVAADPVVQQLQAKILGWRDREKKRYHTFDPKIAEQSAQLEVLNDQKAALEVKCRVIRRKIAVMCLRRAYRRGPLRAYERAVKARIREVKRHLVTDILRSNRRLLEKELDEHELDLTGKVVQKGEHFRTIKHYWGPGLPKRPPGRPKGSGAKAEPAPAPASVPVSGDSTAGPEGSTAAGQAAHDIGTVERPMAATSLADKVAEHSFGGGNDNLKVDAASAAKLAAGGDPGKPD